MDPKYIIGGLVLLVVIIVVLVFALKSDDSGNGNGKTQVSLDGFAGALRDINVRLSTVKCISQAVLALFANIGTIDQQAKALMKQPNVFIKPTSIAAYNSALGTVNATMTRIQATYQPCSTTCYQATYNDTTQQCECKDPTYPVLVTGSDGKPYCFKQDCTKLQNGAPIFSPDKDPAKNDCGCLTGFEHDNPNDGKCWSTPNSSALDGFSTGLGNINSQLITDFAPACPGGGNCSGNGTCDPQTGTCTCNPSWNLPDCSSQSQGTTAQCYATTPQFPTPSASPVSINKGSNDNMSCATALNKLSPQFTCSYALTDVPDPSAPNKFVQFPCDHVFNY